MARTLVCVVCELRAARLTFDGFNKHLLEPNRADLLLCIAERDGECRDNDYARAARYARVYDELPDYTPLFDRYAKRWGAPPSADWRTLARIGRHWLGGLRTERSIAAFAARFARDLRRTDYASFAERLRCLGGTVRRFATGRGAFDQSGAAGVVLAFRQRLLDMITSLGLLERYDRFVITRSDYFYAAPHPSCDLLDPGFAWLPEGEDYRGLCDRHWILSREHVEPCLDLLGPILKDPDALYREMQHDDRWNIEKYIRHVWTKRSIPIRRYPRTMFLVRDADDRSNHSIGAFNREIGMVVKYKSEFEDARANLDAFRDASCWSAWNRDLQVAPSPTPATVTVTVSATPPAPATAAAGLTSH